MFSSGVLRVSPRSCELKVYQKIAPSWVCLFFSPELVPHWCFFSPNWVCLLNILSSRHPLFFPPGTRGTSGLRRWGDFSPARPGDLATRHSSFARLASRFSEELREIFGKEAAALAPFVECGGLGAGLDSASSATDSAPTAMPWRPTRHPRPPGFVVFVVWLWGVDHGLIKT